MSAHPKSFPPMSPENSIQPQNEWEKDFIEWLRFLPRINQNGGSENCDSCSLKLNDIFNKGFSKQLNPVTTKKSTLFTFVTLDENGKLAGSIIYDQRILKRCKVQGISQDDFIYYEEDGLSDFRLIEKDIITMETETIGDSVKEKGKTSKKGKAKLACFVTTRETIAEDLTFFNKRKGSLDWKISVDRNCDNSSTGHGIIIAHYRNPIKNDAHVFNYIIGPNDQLIFIDAQLAKISRTISMDEFTEEFFFLPSIPPEGYILKKENNNSVQNNEFKIKMEIQEKKSEIEDEALLFKAAKSGSYVNVEELLNLGARIHAEPFLSNQPLLERIQPYANHIDKRVIESLETASLKELSAIGINFIDSDFANSRLSQGKSDPGSNLYRFLKAIVLCQCLSNFREKLASLNLENPTDISMSFSFYPSNINVDILLVSIYSGSIKLIDETIALIKDIYSAKSQHSLDFKDITARGNPFSSFLSFTSPKAKYADSVTHVLEAAAQSGYTAVFKHLTALFPGLFKETRKYVLRGAIRGGHPQMLQMILEEDPALFYEVFEYQKPRIFGKSPSDSVLEKQQKTAISLTIEMNRPEAFDLLMAMEVKHAKSIFNVELDNASILCQAVSFERLAMVEKIINYDPFTLYHTDNNGKTAFFQACGLKSKSATKMIEIMLAKDQTLRNNLLSTVNDRGETCFHALAFSGNLEILQKLVRQGAAKHPLFYAQDNWGQTILHHAIWGNWINVVKFLVTNCNSNNKLLQARTKAGYANIHFACMHSFDSLIFLHTLDEKILLETERLNFTTLMYATSLETLRRNPETYLAKVAYIVKNAPALLSVESQQGQKTLNFIMKDKSKLEKEIGDSKQSSLRQDLFREMSLLKQCQDFIENEVRTNLEISVRNEAKRKEAIRNEAKHSMEQFADKFQQIAQNQDKIAKQNELFARQNQSIFGKKNIIFTIENKINAQKLNASLTGMDISANGLNGNKNNIHRSTDEASELSFLNNQLKKQEMIILSNDQMHKTNEDILSRLSTQEIQLKEKLSQLEDNRKQSQKGKKRMLSTLIIAENAMNHSEGTESPNTIPAQNPESRKKKRKIYKENETGVLTDFQPVFK